MPRISAFYGIIVWMYWKDHNPPHIHATYGEFEILINLIDFSTYAGNIPSRAFGLLMEWISIHHEAFRRLGTNEALTSFKDYRTIKIISFALIH